MAYPCVFAAAHHRDMTMKSAGDRPQEEDHFRTPRRPSDSPVHPPPGPSPELLARADAGWERFLRAAHGQAAPSDG